MAFFGALFAARTDIYAVRYENRRAGRAGWVPAVRGGWRKGVLHAERDYLPLTAEVLAAHLSGRMLTGYTARCARHCPQHEELHRADFSSLPSSGAICPQNIRLML